MVAMPALAADWGSGDGPGTSYADSTHSKRYKFFSSDEETTPTKVASSGTRPAYPMKGCVNLNGTALRHAADGIPEPRVQLFDDSKLSLSWNDNKLPAGAGLSNLGNTCFLNSVLQCLAYTAPLALHLTREGHKRYCKYNEFCMLCALQDHLVRCYQNRGSAFKPLQILQNLKNIARCLTWGQQEDAHEFLRYVVDSMQKSCLAGTNGLDRHSKETTFVHRVFGGYLRSQVKCLKCHHPSNTYDPFLDLSVDIKECHDVEQALRRFIAPEMLDIDNAYKCEKCQVKVRAEKKFTIHRSSNVLTLHLKRFDMNRMLGSKISRHIKFPMILNIRPYMSKTQGEPVTYALYGVLVHSGFSCNSGHYYCYVRAPNGQWYCMNDSTVTVSSIAKVMDAEAYILFYVRVKKNRQPNREAPHTVTRPDMMNGSGDHVPVQRRTIIGPQLPPSSTAQPSPGPAATPNHYTVNRFSVNKPGTLISHKNNVVRVSNGKAHKPLVITGVKSVTASQAKPKPAIMVPSLVANYEDEEEDDSNDSQSKKSQAVNGKPISPIVSPSKHNKLTLSEYSARQHDKKTTDGAAHNGSMLTLTNGASVAHTTINNSNGMMKFTPRAVKIGTTAGVVKTEQKLLVNTDSTVSPDSGAGLPTSKSELLLVTAAAKPELCSMCSLERCYCNTTKGTAGSSDRLLNDTASTNGSMSESPAMCNGKLLSTSHEKPENITTLKDNGSKPRDADKSVGSAEKSMLSTKVEGNYADSKNLSNKPQCNNQSVNSETRNGVSQNNGHKSKYEDKVRTPRKRSQSPRKRSRSPRRRTRSPHTYRQYSRSPYRRTYGRRSRSPLTPEHRRRRSRSPRHKRSRSRSNNTRCFSSHKHRHKTNKRDSYSPSHRRHSSRSASPNHTRHYDRHNGYKHTYSDRRRSDHHRSSRYTDHSRQSNGKRRSDLNDDRASPNKRRKRSSSSPSPSQHDKHQEKKPLITNSSDEEQFQWVEVTKDKLKSRKGESES